MRHLLLRSTLETTKGVGIGKSIGNSFGNLKFGRKGTSLFRGGSGRCPQKLRGFLLVKPCGRLQSRQSAGKTGRYYSEGAHKSTNQVLPVDSKLREGCKELGYPNILLNECFKPLGVFAI